MLNFETKFRRNANYFSYELEDVPVEGISTEQGSKKSRHDNVHSFTPCYLEGSCETNIREKPVTSLALN